MKFVITRDSVVQIMQYLQSRPYREVVGLIGLLHNLPVFNDSEPVEAKPENKDKLNG